jgi:hypothetical protein
MSSSDSCFARPNPELRFLYARREDGVLKVEPAILK